MQIFQCLLFHIKLFQIFPRPGCSFLSFFSSASIYVPRILGCLARSLLLLYMTSKLHDFTVSVPADKHTRYARAPEMVASSCPSAGCTPRLYITCVCTHRRFELHRTWTTDRSNSFAICTESPFNGKRTRDGVGEKLFVEWWFALVSFFDERGRIGFWKSILVLDTAAGAELSVEFPPRGIFFFFFLFFFFRTFLARSYGSNEIYEVR